MTFAFLLLFLFQRRKNQRLHAGIRERLEREVALRTAELREAQDGLVHAAKMAARWGRCRRPWRMRSTSR